MSEEQLKAFLEKVKGDTSLQEKLMAAADANAVVAIAKDAGFKISTESIEKFMTEISDKELEGVNGGVLHQTRGGTVTMNPFISRGGQIFIGGKEWKM